MQPVDGGGTRTTAAEREAAREAEEAARRAAEEAARRAAEAARQRLIELNTMDGYQASPPPTVFSAPVQAPALAAAAAATYTPTEAALLAASRPPAAGASLLSPQDQNELALLAHRMEEHGAAPEQVQRALANARLVQIERDQEALALVDGAALETQGRTFELSAQQALDHYISNVDSIYSGLAPVDRAQAGYLAYEQNATAKGLTYQALVIETQSAGLDLERAILERQLAVEAGAPASSLAVFDARIADARQLLDGAPAVRLQVQDLERRLDILRKGAELYDPNRPPDWRTQFAKNEAALQSQIAELRLQVPGNALLARLASAQGAYDTAAQQLTLARDEWGVAVADYHAQLQAQLPTAQAGIESFRTSLDLATSAPALDQALRDLQAILPTASPERLGAALDRIQALPNGDLVVGRLQGADGFLAGDPRLRVLAGREIGVPQGLERLGQEIVLNTLLVGIPSFLENQRLLDAAGAGPDLVAQARFGLGMDYLGFVLTVAGPVVEGVSAVVRGGRTVVELGPEMRSALRAAGYADEVIDGVAQSLGSVAASSSRLQELLLVGTPSERESLLQLLGPHLTTEAYELRRLPGHPGAVNQLVARPAEIVDFLVRSDDLTVQRFWRLVDQGVTEVDARTMVTLVRNGGSLPEVQLAQQQGRLQQLVSETLFTPVSAAEAHKLSGIPRTFLSGGSIEDIAELARREGVDILLRDANEGLEATMAARWPKDNAAHFTYGGTDVKVASIPQQTSAGVVRFKTDKSARVVLQLQDPNDVDKWVSQDLYVVHRPGDSPWALLPAAELDALPKDWWAMGGDIDVLAVLEKRGDGYALLSDTGARETALRADLNRIATVPEPLHEAGVPGLIVHGSSLPYFNTNRGWTPALVFTSDGQMIRLASDDAVEYWFKMRGVQSEPHIAASTAGASFRLGIPASATSYLAGTFVGNLPEIGAAFPGGSPGLAADTTPGGVVPSSTPTATPTPSR